MKKISNCFINNKNNKNLLKNFCLNKNTNKSRDEMIFDKNSSKNFCSNENINKSRDKIIIDKNSSKDFCLNKNIKKIAW